jgi:ADP-ribose pyrophosphatase
MDDQVREVYKGKVLRVELHRVRLPNGNQATLEIIRHPGAAAVVPFVTPDEILLVRQYRHAAGGYLLEVPAGKLDPGETPERCAEREVEEEVGRRPGRLERLGAIHTTPGFTNEVIHLFAAYDLAPGVTAHERDEVMSVVRVGFAEALHMVERGEISDAKSVSALLLAARRRGE